MRKTDLHDATAQLLEPLDSAADIHVQSNGPYKLPTSPEMPVLPRPVLRASHTLDVDEAQLLAETEELLDSLDPTAFVVTPTPKQITNTASSLCTSSSSSENDSSVSQYPAKPDASVKCSRKRVPKPGVMRNPSRERQQNELSTLRKQVLALENELENAQKQQALVAQPSEESAKWERIAKRQLTACKQAVSENKRLKSMLELQKELVVGLEESLYNWQHVITQLPALLASDDHQPPHKTVHLEPGDDLLFEVLVSKLDATYLKIDEAFHDSRLDKLGNEPIKRTTPKTLAASDGSLRSYFELVEVDVTPFDFKATIEAAKVCGEKQSQSPDCVVYSRDWGSECIITKKHRVRRIFNGVEVYFHMLLALKLHEFADHVVTVWRSMFKSEDPHNFPDTYVKETGWMMSSRLVHSANDIPSTGEGSLYRMCVHLEPRRFTSSATVVKAEADTMTTLVLDAYYDDMQELDDMMENILIQESLKSTLTL